MHSITTKRSKNSFLPLTKENLQSFDSHNSFRNNNEILDRYCRDMESLNKNTLAQQYAQDINRSQSTPPMFKNDMVVTSPRILPFPYHNDSLFLPTAEQIHYNLQSSTQDTLSTSRAESFSTFPPETSAFLSRPHSTSNIHRSSNYSISINSGVQYQHERRSLPARFEQQLLSRKFRRLRRTSSVSSSSFASTVEHPVIEAPIKFAPNAQHKKPWIQRVIQIFKFKSQKSNQSQDKNPVWYCQYSESPASKFEKYNSHEPVIVVS